VLFSTWGTAAALALKQASATIPIVAGAVGDPMAAEKRDPKSIEEGKVRTTDAARILNDQFAETNYIAGDAFSYGDIPTAVLVRRYRAPGLNQLRLAVTELGPQP
jgi:glutathione S-transferase